MLLIIQQRWAPQLWLRSWMAGTGSRSSRDESSAAPQSFLHSTAYFTCNLCGAHLIFGFSFRWSRVSFQSRKKIPWLLALKNYFLSPSWDCKLILGLQKNECCGIFSIPTPAPLNGPVSVLQLGSSSLLIGSSALSLFWCFISNPSAGMSKNKNILPQDCTHWWKQQ